MLYVCSIKEQRKKEEVMREPIVDTFVESLINDKNIKVSEYDWYIQEIGFVYDYNADVFELCGDFMLLGYKK